MFATCYLPDSVGIGTVVTDDAHVVLEVVLALDGHEVGGVAGARDPLDDIAQGGGSGHALREEEVGVSRVGQKVSGDRGEGL